MVECAVRGSVAVDVEKCWVFYRVCEMEVAKEEGVVSMADECLEKAGDNRMVGVTKVAAIGAEIKIERMDEVGVVM